MKTSAAGILGLAVALAPAPVAHADQATFLADIASEGSFSQIPSSALGPGDRSVLGSAPDSDTRSYSSLGGGLE